MNLSLKLGRVLVRFNDAISVQLHMGFPKAETAKENLKYLGEFV